MNWPRPPLPDRLECERVGGRERTEIDPGETLDVRHRHLIETRLGIREYLEAAAAHLGFEPAETIHVEQEVFLAHQESRCSQAAVATTGHDFEKDLRDPNAPERRVRMASATQIQ